MPDAPAQEKIYPIIIVHAITAGGLHDHYPIDQERVWGPGELAFKLFDRISLYPTTGIADERMRYEAHGPSLVRPSEVFKMIYGELVAELLAGLEALPQVLELERPRHQRADGVAVAQVK